MIPIMFRAAALRIPSAVLPLLGAPEALMLPRRPWGRLAHQKAWARPISSSQRLKKKRNGKTRKNAFNVTSTGGYATQPYKGQSP